MEKAKKSFCIAVCLLAAFAAWTGVVCFVDVRAIGPQGSSVGLAGVNRLVHSMTGVHFALYTVTDWLGLVPLGVCAGFGLLGLVQWIKRKSILRVDSSILALGGLYLVTMTAYVFFEHVVINYRPVLIEGMLEASYPSSTTMLSMCVMPTAVIELNARMKKSVLRQGLSFVMLAFTAFMVIGRLISGVHWFSDIIGGVLLSAGLVTMYHAVVCLMQR